MSGKMNGSMNGDANDLIELLDRWQPRRVLVVGDFMLDRYAYGNAERLSPDAPVPVLAVERTESYAGGAGNVCRNLAALGCQVRTLGLIGDDEPGQTLRGALEDQGIDTTGLMSLEDRPTTVKYSLMGLAQHRHAQKMFRLDTEDTRPIDGAVASALLERAEVLLEGVDALALEDYGKGVLASEVCAALIAMAHARGILVWVDPAAIEDYAKYRGATCITPNRTEAHRVTGLTDPQAMARRLQTTLEIPFVVVTLDKEGALLLDDAGTVTLLPTVARQVYDVTGAGDMVLAALVTAHTNGASWPQAVALANVAAGLEVERVGAVPIRRDELLLALLREHHGILGKARDIESLVVELEAHRQSGKKIIFTNGCFDVLHAGHVSYLRQARRFGDLLVVGLNADASITRLKGPDRPINVLDDRMLVLSELESVDYVVVFEEDTPLALIKQVKPDVLVKGADYQRKDVVGGDFVEAHGGEVRLIELVPGRSSTQTLKRLREL
ncbi:MAG: D-glycero-beta-D-manno-heptose 1-phosphate adenylyltransferase [Algisphaera sp.]